MDYYALLNVPKDASKENIKKAFMQQALKWHPEKAENDKERETFTKVYADLQQAYKILSNDETRKMYQDTQQNTFDDFRKQERDLGYQHTDKFSKKTDTGMKFDGDMFKDAFHQSRDRKEQEAFANLTENVTDDVVTVNDYKTLLEQRQQERDLLDNNTTDLYDGRKFDSNQFNRAFDFMKQQHTSNAVQEYHGEPMGMFSTGGLVEDDGMSGLSMSNGMNFMGGNMDGMINGAGYNPSAGFDMSQFASDAYEEETPMSQQDMNARMEAAQKDRERLSTMDKSQFSTEASEIEKMYAGLYVPRDVEGLDAPIGVACDDEETSASKSKSTVLKRKIALKKKTIETN